LQFSFRKIFIHHTKSIVITSGTYQKRSGCDLSRDDASKSIFADWKKQNKRKLSVKVDNWTGAQTKNLLNSDA
jgi:hypothetical protein